MHGPRIEPILAVTDSSESDSEWLQRQAKERSKGRKGNSSKFKAKVRLTKRRKINDPVQIQATLAKNSKKCRQNCREAFREAAAYKELVAFRDDWAGLHKLDQDNVVFWLIQISSAETVWWMSPPFFVFNMSTQMRFSERFAMFCGLGKRVDASPNGSFSKNAFVSVAFVLCTVLALWSICCIVFLLCCLILIFIGPSRTIKGIQRLYRFLDGLLQIDIKFTASLSVTRWCRTHSISKILVIVVLKRFCAAPAETVSREVKPVPSLILQVNNLVTCLQSGVGFWNWAWLVVHLPFGFLATVWAWKKEWPRSSLNHYNFVQPFEQAAT